MIWKTTCPSWRWTRRLLRTVSPAKVGTYTGCEMGEPSTRLRLRVVPGAGRSEIVGRYGEAWKVRVGAVPERGRANEELLKLLSEQLRVRMAKLAIVSGRTGRDKVVELRGLSAAEVASRMKGQRVDG